VLSLTAILEIIKGVIRFPGEVLSLVRFLKDAPEESREKIMLAMRKEADEFEQSGRPKWDA
jgi:hypothetical protein